MYGLGAVGLESDQGVAGLVERRHLDGFRRENGTLPLSAEGKKHKQSTSHVCMYVCMYVCITII